MWTIYLFLINYLILANTMNCPHRPDNGNGREGWNQSPNLLSGTTREDFNGKANTRVLRGVESTNSASLKSTDEVPHVQRPPQSSDRSTLTGPNAEKRPVKSKFFGRHNSRDDTCGFISKTRKFMVTLGKFVGPGFMVCAVPYSGSRRQLCSTTRGLVGCI